MYYCYYIIIFLIQQTFFKLRELVDGDAELPSYKFSFDNLNESVQSRVFEWVRNNNYFSIAFELLYKMLYTQYLG